MKAEPGRRSVVLIGDPAELSEFSAWASAHGVFIAEDVDSDSLCAIATEDALDGTCSPEDALLLSAADKLGLQCLNTAEGRRLLEGAEHTNAVSARPSMHGMRIIDCTL
ncbi:hypothetical protein [Rhodococcus maanshanensis]|uniref:Uncharacterized protein n=1 Tax=Rhodococcus maanshanensis TaxID=183556 RepID=A0A1H7LNR7_9NOCA|nr:hypothetical protein [Rhodococcus maanshanensis]SEL00027.1 hypothetical protein SAMN05444583_10595 [Rhodococcus maanshanensis]